MSNEPFYLGEGNGSAISDHSDTFQTHEAESTLGGAGPRKQKGEEKLSFQVEYRTWLQRTFGAMNPGSVRASIFSLVSTALGTGILALPFLLRTSGLILGLSFLVLGAFLCLITLSMLSYCSFQMQETEYSALVERVLGKKAAKLMDYIMVFYGFGSSTGYQITIAQFLPMIIAKFYDVDQYDLPTWQRLVQISIVTIIAFPVSLTKNLYGIRYATYFGVTCIFYTLFVVVIQTPAYISEKDSLSHIQYSRWNLNFFTSFAIASFSYTCHSNLFPVRSELARAKDARLKKVVSRVVLVQSFLYFTMAICGYLSLTNETTPLILTRPKLPSVSFDWVMLLALIAISFTLVISIIINIVPTRLQVLLMMGKHKDTDNKTYTIVTAILVFGTGIVAMVATDIKAALGLIGGVGSVSLSITYPFLLYAKVREMDTSDDSKSKKWLILGIRFLAVVFSLLGTVGAIISCGQAVNLIDKYE